jgi:hypothetical protein
VRNKSYLRTAIDWRIIGSIEMSVAPAPTNVRRVRQRSCCPSLVTCTPSTAGNSRADDALSGEMQMRQSSIGETR